MSPPHVLLVDNDPLDAELTRDILEGPELGTRVTLMHGGEEALAFFAQAETAPDLVLLDVNMPRVNGFEVLARLKVCAHWAGVPVVLFSTSDDERDRRRGLAGGAAEYLVKPMRLEALERLLRALMARWDQGQATVPAPGHS